MRSEKRGSEDVKASPQGRPIGPQTISAMIGRALRPGPPPPYDELVVLEQTLLHVIGRLWAAAHEAERRGPGTPGREPRRARLEAIRYQTAVGLGDGLMSAQLQVRALARECQWLLDQCPAEAGR